MEKQWANAMPGAELLRVARAAGRKITAIGGGTGLSTLLLGLKEYTDNITAVVTVTDDGGGSGMLREEFGILPPGDIRNCILSLANTSDMMNELINYRFNTGSLKGQSFGNLFLLALCGICGGNFEMAVARMNEVLAVTGKVLPVTSANVKLAADFEDGSKIEGETAITRVKKQNGLSIQKVSLLPPGAKALPQVIEAIEEADVLLLGPGSLYTSIIPNLLVEGVAEAICRSRALKIYLLNIMTQDGETEGYTAADHIRALQAHGGETLVDLCLYNTDPVAQKLLCRYAGESAKQLWPDRGEFGKLGVRLKGASILSRDAELVRHDPLRLAHAIMKTAMEEAPREGVLQEYDRLMLIREKPQRHEKTKLGRPGIE